MSNCFSRRKKPKRSPERTLRRPEGESTALRAAHRETALHPVVHVDGENIGKDHAVLGYRFRFALEEAHFFRQFVFDPEPGQRQGLAVGDLYLQDDFFAEKDLVMAQAALELDAVEAKPVPQPGYAAGQQKQEADQGQGHLVQRQADNQDEDREEQPVVAPHRLPFPGDFFYRHGHGVHYLFEGLLGFLAAQSTLRLRDNAVDEHGRHQVLDIVRGNISPSPDGGEGL